MVGVGKTPPENLAMQSHELSQDALSDNHLITTTIGDGYHIVTLFALCYNGYEIKNSEENVDLQLARIKRSVMAVSKQEVLDFINTMPDDISFADVLYNLYVMSNIIAGLDDIEAGRTHSHDEIKRMFA